MQKIFRKYIIIIMSISLASVLLINFFLSTDSLQARTLECCSGDLADLKSSLDEEQKHLLMLLKKILISLKVSLNFKI